jgi:TPR repeat protein
MAADDGGFIPATHNVGLMFQSGYGGEKNIVKAVTYFDRAGKAGFGPSQYTLGEIYYNGADGVPQDKTRAGAWLLLAAKSGVPDALYAVGRMYDIGEGGATADLPKALIYYKEAAIKGQVDAQTTLATYLYTGEGGAPKDPVTARKLFQAAAEQGEPEAMFNLGVMLFNGEGGPKDRGMAFVWFRLAAASGLDKAADAAAELGPKLTPDERAQAEAVLNPKKATPKS